MAKKTEKKDIPQIPQPIAQGRLWRYSLVLLLVGAVVIAWLSMLTFNETDPPAKLLYPAKDPVDNAAGIVGARLAYWLRYWVGGGAYVGLIFASIAAGWLICGKTIRDLPWRLIGVGLLIVSISSAIYMVSPSTPEDLGSGLSGVLGLGVGKFMQERFAVTGSWILLLITISIGMLLTVDTLVLAILERIKKLWHRRGDLGQAVSSFALPKLATSSGESSVVTSSPRPIAAMPGTAGKINRSMPAPVKREAPSKDDDASADSPRDSVSAMAKKVVARMLPASKPKEDKQPAEAPKASPAKTASTPPAPALSSSSGDGYSLPPIDLLVAPQGGYIESQQEYACQQQVVLQRTLNEFRVGAEVVGYQTGPVITMFELALAPGVKVSNVGNLSEDIARSLAVPGVRIVSPLPGKDTIGIEVPNMEKEVVRIRELMDLCPEAQEKMALPVYLGKDAGGGAIVTDLAAMPHGLIAGTTGSGKSVCINAIIMSLLLTRTPQEAKFIMIDPKMVEMAAFEKIPHLLCPIINDMRKAEGILEWAATKMDERYELLKEAGVRNIKGYNELSENELYERVGVQSDEEKAKLPKKMPYYVIIIDELADLMMTAGKEVESHIIRIAQKARAVGIHLVLATQRPSVNVVTGLIKSNMPCRISFRVASRQESRIVLDQNGAEVLLGHGDMLLLEPGTSNLKRAQGTFIADKEIREVTKLLNKSGEQNFDTELTRMNSSDFSEGSMERDELFDKAVEIVLSSKRGSVSLLQRRLQIGYSRSSRIIDQMADAGLLGEYKGSQAREVTMTLDDWRALQASIKADQSGASSLDGSPTSV